MVRASKNTIPGVFSMIEPHQQQHKVQLASAIAVAAPHAPAPLSAPNPPSEHTAPNGNGNGKAPVLVKSKEAVAVEAKTEHNPTATQAAPAAVETQAEPSHVQSNGAGTAREPSSVKVMQAMQAARDQVRAAPAHQSASSSSQDLNH